jgi:hypothetical protein
MPILTSLNKFKVGRWPCAGRGPAAMPLPDVVAVARERFAGRGGAGFARSQKAVELKCCDGRLKWYN